MRCRLPVWQRGCASSVPTALERGALDALVAQSCLLRRRDRARANETRARVAARRARSAPVRVLLVLNVLRPASRRLIVPAARRRPLRARPSRRPARLGGGATGRTGADGARGGAVRWSAGECRWSGRAARVARRDARIAPRVRPGARTSSSRRALDPTRRWLAPDLAKRAPGDVVSTHGARARQQPSKSRPW